ncbi:molybdopterin-synthase adenylyltransferase [bacterium BMS3Abin07]|nr:molybdopterin-synthase adenylyltransferase [bacterium BMS3Abin07]GBE31725.1 molybdopterin-synthase adenylyltransferase [bacterium BMS3Bbin05]
MLQGFDPACQRKLKESTVLVAGIGGLGGTAAVYLAIAGIGRMILVHPGNLTLSNMNRQILMRHDWIGKRRVIQGKRTIEEINPDVEIEIYDKRITRENAVQLLEGVQVAISARPNFAERRVLNYASIERGISMVEAAMNGMEGYLFNVIPGETPCLNCLYPDDDPEWEELGFPVLGAVSGMLGCIMSIEAIKLLTGFGKPLKNRMLIFNMLNMDFTRLNIRRDKNCPVCMGKTNKAMRADN